MIYMRFLRKIWTMPSNAGILVLAFGDNRTPLRTKLIICATFVYLFSPVDLIPDFIPFAGWLDDLIIVPALMFFAIKQLPPLILVQARSKAGLYLRKVKLIMGIFLSTLIAFLSFLVWLIFF